MFLELYKWYQIVQYITYTFTAIRHSTIETGKKHLTHGLFFGLLACVIGFLNLFSALLTVRRGDNSCCGGGFGRIS